MSRTALRVTLVALVSVAVGLGIVIGMMRMTHIHLDALLRSLEHARPAPLAAVLLATLLHLWITSLKWQMVTEAAGEAERLRGSFFGYTAASALVGQFVPQQVAAVAVRTLAGRLHQRTPVTRAAGLAIFDQLIDLLPPAAFLLPAVLCMTHRLDPWAGALIAGVTLVITAAFLPKALKATAALASHARGFLPSAIRSNLRSAPLPAGPTLSKLFAWSIIRYLNLTIRYYLLALCIGASHLSDDDRGSNAGDHPDISVCGHSRRAWAGGTGLGSRPHRGGSFTGRRS